MANAYDFSQFQNFYPKNRYEGLRTPTMENVNAAIQAMKEQEAAKERAKQLAAEEAATRAVLDGSAGSAGNASPQPVTPQPAASDAQTAAAVQQAADAQTAQQQAVQQAAQAPAQAQSSHMSPYAFLSANAYKIRAAQPQTATDVQAENPQARQQLINDLAQTSAFQPLSMRERLLVNGLANAKTDWQQAYEAGDEAAMARAHDNAEGYRTYANQIGLDLSKFGADNMNAAQMQGYLQADYANAVGDLLQGKTAQDVYSESYQFLKGKGYSDRAARNAALQKADDFHAKRIQNLGAAFTMYGINQGTGEMNDYGAGILSQLSSEDPDAAGMLMSMYATPIQKWTVDKNMAAAHAATVDKQALLGQQIEGQKDLANINGEWLIKQLVQKGVNDQAIAEIQKALGIHQSDNQKEVGLAAALAGGKIGKNGAVSFSGSGSKSGGGGMTTSQAMEIIKAYHEQANKHPGEPNPYEDYLPAAMAVMDGTSGITHDMDNYNDVLSDWTTVLEGNAANMRNGVNYYTKEQLQDYAKSKYGDFAGKVFEDTNWSDYGL